LLTLGDVERENRGQYLNSSVSDCTDFSRVEDLPVLIMEGLVEPPCCLWGRHVHEPIPHIAFVTV